MDKNVTTINELQQELDQIISTGIKADSKNLKKDMCSQFSDFREWIREYVVNAYDAQAGFCKISGREDGDKITITVKDNGHGMDKQGLIDYFTLYRSVKKGDPDKTIGKHGIGKLSVASIPGQCRFFVLSSNSKETWKAEAGSLLDDCPITIEPVDVILPQGTTFEITFVKENQLQQEMKRLYDILKKYTRYLPMDIIISMTDEVTNEEQVKIIHDEWLPSPETSGKSYQYKHNGKIFNITLYIDNSEHEIYQNRVFITGKYNLLSQDLNKSLHIPYINIRVDSPDFELPFGRHCLRNEEILFPLTSYIRETVLPDYIYYLQNFNADDYNNIKLKFHVVEELISHMLKIFKDRGIWNTHPLFRDYSGRRYSLAELKQIINVKGHIYLEDGSNIGIDYSIFDAPVLSQNQAGVAMDVLNEIFNDKLVNLSLNDVIIEAPARDNSLLSEDEKNFEKCLYFYPDNIDVNAMLNQNNPNSRSMFNSVMENMNNNKLDGVCEEIKSSKEELARIKWKVSYLVERDGRTPCYSHKFILKLNTVVLNLHHQDIKQLVKLSKIAPALAGHWAIALCLTDNNKVLSHLTPEAREELLFIDAMSKIGTNSTPGSIKQVEEDTFIDYIKNSIYFNNYKNN